MPIHEQMTHEQIALQPLNRTRQGLLARELLKDDATAELVYQIWNRQLPPPEVFSDLDLSKLICIFIGANSLQELKDRDSSCYYDLLETFCRISGYDMADIIFYRGWTAMRDGEVSRERDTDAVYLPFVDGHGMYWPGRKFEVEISEGYGKSGSRPASERLSYLKELDRKILLVISLICWSKQVADVFLDGGLKYVYPQDDFEIDAYAVEFEHRTKSLELYLTKAFAGFIPFAILVADASMTTKG